MRVPTQRNRDYEPFSKALETSLGFKKPIGGVIFMIFIRKNDCFRQYLASIGNIQLISNIWLSNLYFKGEK